ncbi:hypothetical protein EYF80_004675 [Liparis tanakae]|uniref:Uncharacterized protein n=1 Tax=Liparis tanakae TaxID=230148 RepID=A0A4Z2J501_9TELE|nr:hypothetical protein EYF80_004675 [Liparis tanakae]
MYHNNASDSPSAAASGGRRGRVHPSRIGRSHGGSGGRYLAMTRTRLDDTSADRMEEKRDAIATETAAPVCKHTVCQVSV